MYAVLLLPNFRLQAALRFRSVTVGAAFAVTDGENFVSERNETAAAFGVSAGMAATQALARCPRLTLLFRAVETEQVLGQTLLEVADTLSAEIEATGEGCCTVDLRRAAVRDWKSWCEAAGQRLAVLELRARIGVAPNPDLAFIAARRAESFLVVHAPAPFLAQLAISEIDPPPHLLALLRDWGIHTLGQFTALPRGELADRLGPEMDLLWQRAAGQTERLLRLVRPVEMFVEYFEFEHEIETVEPLLFLLRRFLDQLTLRLAAVHRVAARLTLQLPMDNGTKHERVFTVPTPTGDAAVLFRILHTHLEDLKLEAHPTGVRLQIDPVRPEHQQFRLFESPLRDPNRFGETLARLAALVGADNVGVAEVKDTHRPDAFQLNEPRFHQLAESSVKPEENLSIGLPLRRYRPPFAAKVRIQQRHPVEIESSIVHGRIVDVLGPYRASGDWWDKERWAVEEWDVEVEEQGLYRLHREIGGWFLDGCYDNALR